MLACMPAIAVLILPAKKIWHALVSLQASSPSSGLSSPLGEHPTPQPQPTFIGACHRDLPLPYEPLQWLQGLGELAAAASLGTQQSVFLWSLNSQGHSPTLGLLKKLFSFFWTWTGFSESFLILFFESLTEYLSWGVQMQHSHWL